MMEMESIQRLTKDLKTAAVKLTDHEARFLVDYYYIAQEDRKRSNNQVLSLEKNQEPNAVVSWLANQAETLEGQVKRALDAYTDGHVMGAWMRQIVGIGPVISAGLLAHIDITKAPTVGHIWRYAGLDPTSKWAGKKGAEDFVAEHGINFELAARMIGMSEETLRRMALNDKGKVTETSFTNALKRRPWNSSLKTLCWKVGQSFMKFSGRDDCYYGKIYKERKAYEVARNERGDNKALAEALIGKFKKSTEAYGYLKSGVLPPAQIDARARRYAVKLFLSHLHGAWYEAHYGTKPPLPYPIAHMGHAHFIPAPV
jgi:hypothetical protein